jgi:hypothetical protein
MHALHRQRKQIVRVLSRRQYGAVCPWFENTELTKHPDLQAQYWARFEDQPATEIEPVHSALGAASLSPRPATVRSFALNVVTTQSAKRIGTASAGNAPKCHVLGRFNT